MSIHPMLKQQPDFTEVEYKLRDLQRAASLLNYVGLAGAIAAHQGTDAEFADMQGISWLGEQIKAMADDLDATLFPKTPKAASD